MTLKAFYKPTKIDYIHHNAVKEKIVTSPEDYYYSSARNYAKLDYELELLDNLKLSKNSPNEKNYFPSMYAN